MAPSRHHHNHHHNHHGGGHNGSPFPPLGMAASGIAASGASTAGSNGHIGTGAAASAMSASGSSHGFRHESGSSGLPPAPSKVDTTQAQTYRLQDAYWSDDDEDMDCPLCLEEIDISDANFKPCPCGYQICRFCWHHIKSNLNGRCPACRRKYSDNTVEFKPMSQDEIKKLSQAKKQKEREKRELEQMNRKHLANMRVVQKNLVYVVGMDPKLAREELIPTLRSQEYFGQYGRISKILISKRTTASKLIMGTSESAIGVYVTYVRKEDAARAIIAIDSSKSADGRTIRASYGTTKYCTTYLRNLPCSNPICTYLHEPGEEADSFTKEDLTTLRHAAKDTEARNRPPPAPGSFGNSGSSTAVPTQASQQAVQAAPVAPAPANVVSSVNDLTESSALPKTVSWATQKQGTANGSALSTSPTANAIRDQDLPPLSALATAQSQRKQQQQQQQPQQPQPQQPPARTTPQTPVAARGITPAPPKIKSRQASGIARAETPLSSPVREVASSPAPSAPPGLTRQPSSLEGPANARTPKAKDTTREDSPLAAPPGLAKIGLPPGLSRSATPVYESPKAEAASATAYQPSSNAQAVLDDMRSRRSAAETRPSKSPFPDFDNTLNSFGDGDDFSFNFEEGLVPPHLRGPSENRSATLGSFAPFTIGHSFGTRTGGATRSLATSRSTSMLVSPPGLGGSALSRPADPPAYSGRFDPFAPGAGESLLSDEEAPSPFATIERMRRNLSEDRGQAAENGEGRENGDEEGSASRFGFAKQREPLKTSDDLLGFIKRGANVHQMSNGFNAGAGMPNGTFANGGISGIDGFGRDSFAFGNGGAEGTTDWRNVSTVPRSSPLASILPLNGMSPSQSIGNNYIADQSYFGGSPASSIGRSSSFGGPGDAFARSESPLLAQLMNRRLNGANAGQSNGMPPFNDPAIMSLNSQQGQHVGSPSLGQRFGDQGTAAPGSGMASSHSNGNQSGGFDALSSQFTGGNRQ